MVKPRLSKLRQRLQPIHAEMGQQLPALVGRELLLPAYLSYRPRTCGNPGCRGAFASTAEAAGSVSAEPLRKGNRNRSRHRFPIAARPPARDGVNDCVDDGMKKSVARPRAPA